MENYLGLNKEIAINPVNGEVCKAGPDGTFDTCRRRQKLLEVLETGGDDEYDFIAQCMARCGERYWECKKSSNKKTR